MNGIATAFQGTLGADAELKFTSGGKAVLSFSVAVSENRAGGDGAETTWIRVAVWEAEAERLTDTLKKGTEVYVEGKLRLNTWTTSDGETRSGLNVSASTAQPLGKLGRSVSRRDQDGAGSLTQHGAIVAMHARGGAG